MLTKKLTVDLEAVKWHILMFLYRKDKPVSPGDIKRKTLGLPISYQEVYDSLWSLGYITQSEDGIQLSVESRHFLSNELKQERQRILYWIGEDEFDMAISSFLYQRPHLVHLEDFPDVLIETAPQYANMVGKGNLTHRLFKLGAQIETQFMHWYGLNQTGRDLFEVKAIKLGRTDSQPIHFGTNSRTHFEQDPIRHFTDGEIREMNAKLDQLKEAINSEFSILRASQEFTYNDIMAEFEEMRSYYNLPKKTWRQLFAGKLAEMVAGGFVSETISKKLADVVNPVVRKMLE